MQTSVSTDHPSVASLREAVAAVFRHPLDTLNDFEQLGVSIEDKTRCHLNADTLRRLWKVRHDAYGTVRLSTLNILSEYVGYADWSAWCEHLRQEGHTESETTAGRRCVYAADMNTGDEVKIGWRPDRTAVLRYAGERYWEVTAVENSRTLQQGDRFCCAALTEGEVLYADNLMRNGVPAGAVRLGMDNGIFIIS